MQTEPNSSPVINYISSGHFYVKYKSWLGLTLHFFAQMSGGKYRNGNGNAVGAFIVISLCLYCFTFDWFESTELERNKIPNK